MKFIKDAALVVLSGGQDSTTCLFWALRRYSRVYAITFDYQQRHRAELTAAYRIARIAGVQNHEVLTLGPVLAGTSPLTNPGEVLEQYKDHKSLPGGLEKTFVPGRNMLFLTLAANRAYVLGASSIITGICEEDSGGYPDCRERFRKAMENVVYHGLDATIRVEAPLMFLSKADTVALAWSLGPEAWHALAFSHTSYDGAYPPIGHDHATLLRAKGFEEARMPDPLVLRAVSEGLMPLPSSKNYQDASLNNSCFNEKLIKNLQDRF